MVSQTIRSFIAIELTAEVRSVLDNVQQGLKTLGLKAKWVRPASIHLTLKFLGNIEPATIEDIGKAMAEAAGDCAPFTLTVGGIGFFPGIKRARVVWAGLGGATGALLNLQRNLADRLETLGIAQEKRPFKAHLTLGRLRQTVNPHILGRAMAEYADLGNLEFSADRIILFRSDLKPTGAVYSHLKQTALIKMTKELRD
jgi:2'-5' RNA ligase